MTEQRGRSSPLNGAGAGPAAGPPAQPKVLIAHDGGPRAGKVAAVPEHLLDGFLVYDGPEWLGVYRRSSPVRTQTTDQGDAEVWTAVE